MNAQEALDELKTTRIYEVKSYFGNNKFTIEQDKDAVEAIQQLIDQANAKPKTLEELGWGLTNNRTIFGREYQTYEKNEQVIFLGNDDKSVRVFDYRNGMCLPCDLTYAELLAIAEKMKELGMTGEQIAKGEMK